MEVVEKVFFFKSLKKKRTLPKVNYYQSNRRTGKDEIR